jgi:uncharacterized protein (TIGR02246 family)
VSLGRRDSAFGGLAPARALLLAALLLGSACRFERRPDLAAGRAADSVPPVAGSSGPVEDSVRAVIAAVTAALDAGDGGRVAQLTARDAVLIDQEDEVRWTRDDAAARLPRPLRAEGEGLGWETDGSTFARLSDASALVSVRLHATPASDSAAWTATESWVLVREDGTWRLRYLHRSRGLAGSQP